MNTTSTRPIRSPARRLARGSIVINTAIALSLIVITLVGAELGYLFYLKRELQKTADLAALAGAQAIEETNCTSAKDAAISNAAQNLPSEFQLQAQDITCGHWDPDPLKPAVPRHFSVEATPFNAVLVSIQRPLPRLLPGIFDLSSNRLSVEAVATQATPSAAFSVGSKLIRLDGDSTLGALLKEIGLNLDNTVVAGYEGLVSARITPGGLLCELGTCAAANITAGGLNDLLNTSVTLGNLLDAIVKAAGQNGFVAANATLISAIKAKLNVEELNVQLGSLTGTSGLFSQITTSDPESALNAQVNVLNLIQAAVGVASRGHAVDVPSLNISLLGLASVTAKAGLIEPPSIAIGPKKITTAYTAQIRTFLHVQSTGILGSLLGVNLPIALDLVAAKGTLEDLCTPALRSPANRQRAEISVDGAILKGCIGKISNSSGSQDCSLPVSDARHKACLDNLIFSKKEACEQNLSDVQLINVLNLIKIKGSPSLAVLPLDPASVQLEEGQTDTVGNPLNIGKTVSNIVGTLLDLLLGGSSAPGSPDPVGMAIEIWNNTGKSVADGGAGCTAGTTTCRTQRLTNAKQRIEQSSAQSGLLSSVLSGLGDLLSGLLTGNGCTSRGIAGPPTSDQGCINLIQDTLSQNSSSNQGGLISNTSIVLTGLVGLLEPLLDAVGNSLLTPLLQKVLGIHIGEVDVKLHSLQCKSAQLVY